MTKIGAFGPDMQYESPVARQISAENQRAAWLRQMESTQISMLEQAGAQEQDAGSNVSQDQTPQNSANSNRSSTRATMPNGNATAFALPTSGATFMGGENHAGTAASMSSATNGAMAKTPLASATSTTVQSLSSSTELSSSMLFKRLNEGAAAMHGTSSSNLPNGVSDSLKQITPTMVPTMATPQSTPEGYSQQNLLAQIAAALATANEAAGNVVEPPTTTTMVRSVSSMASTQLVSTLGTGSGAQETEEASDMTEQHAPKETAETGDASGAEWQKRLLHVTQDGRDVSVSIRDQTLGPNQSNHIVYRLVADVASSGLRLHNAVINGRQVMRSGRFGTTVASAPQDVSTHGIDDSTFQTMTQQEKQHGT